MIREGVLENPQPQAVLGQHVMPALEAGKIAIRPGNFTASLHTPTFEVEEKALALSTGLMAYLALKHLGV